MKKENDSFLRRNFLKTTVFGSIAGAFIAANPIKLLSSKSTNPVKKTVQVKIHPLAVKRNKQD